MSARYTVGIDFGTESARALVVDTASGREVGVGTSSYHHGVIDAALPVTGQPLPPDWALQDPDDYLASMTAAVREAVSSSRVQPGEIIGVGIDFTACTMMPIRADGVPLCRLPEFRDRPHAYVKLWKHHSAQPQADALNARARELGGLFLPRYGGKISSEWFIPKTMQILAEDPEVFHSADRLIEAQDWVVRELVGHEARSLAVAGYKVAYQADLGGYPSAEFLGSLHPDLPLLTEQKVNGPLLQPGAKAGELTAEWAQNLGLATGTAVAVANMDAHVSVAGCGVTDPGVMVMIMGTSICDLLLGEEPREVEGMCGVVRDGVFPGYWAFEAGQSCVGDLFAWYRRAALPASVVREAQEQGVDPLTALERTARSVTPGSNGVVALDWWNGNRSVLVDADLSGLLLGMTLATGPAEVFRALIESTAFGKKMIVDAFDGAGVPVRSMVACGGLPDRNPLLMQIFADVLDLEIKVAASSQAPALGAAIHAAVAAGSGSRGYGQLVDAVGAMVAPARQTYRPDPKGVLSYRPVFAEYRELHDWFGRGGNDVMKRLRRNRAGHLPVPV